MDKVVKNNIGYICVSSDLSEDLETVYKYNYLMMMTFNQPQGKKLIP